MKWFAQFGTKPDLKKKFFFKPYVHLPGSVCSAASIKSRPDTCVLCRAKPTATSGMPQRLCQNKQALSGLAASSSAGQVESRCRCQSPPSALFRALWRCNTYHRLSHSSLPVKARGTEAYLMRCFLPCLSLGWRCNAEPHFPPSK